MKRASLVVTLAGILAAFTQSGCVSRAEYDKLYAAYQSCEGERVSLRNDLKVKDAQLAAVSAERDRLLAERGNVDAALKAEVEKWERLYREALAAQKAPQIQIGTPLPRAIDEALKALAGKYPGLEYDADRGVVRFSSDLIFDLGSWTLKPDVAKQLSDFADVIKMPEAKDYDVLVVGHTDDVRISKPQTQQITPTNWHLSVYRAVSVVQALAKDGVAGNRLGAMGFGQERPRVANVRGGTKENRRVEVFLVPKRSLAAAAWAPLVIPGTDIARLGN